MATKQSPKPKTYAQFEKSKYDNDKGVKEGSPADKKRDAKEMKKLGIKNGK